MTQRPGTAILSSKPAGTGQRMIFTGPDNIGDYRPKHADFTRYVGEFIPLEEGTSDADYLYRAAPNTPHPRPKEMYVGGIGWGVSAFSYLNRRELISDFQIKLCGFRQACEDTISHRYQTPWNPPPYILDKQGFGSRGTLAWTPEKYDNYCYGKSNRSAVCKQSDPLDPVPEPTIRPQNMDVGMKLKKSHQNLP
uniref:Sperm microtubule inner protein 2 n=1 Tax=Leptobrachium leishanense TaxID=445787 RepID=A0A8C5LV09_9ANUR